MFSRAHLYNKFMFSYTWHLYLIFFLILCLARKKWNFKYGCQVYENVNMLYKCALLNIFVIWHFIFGPPILGATYWPKHKGAIFSLGRQSKISTKHVLKSWGHGRSKNVPYEARHFFCDFGFLAPQCFPPIKKVETWTIALCPGKVSMWYIYSAHVTLMW